MNSQGFEKDTKQATRDLSAPAVESLWLRWGVPSAIVLLVALIALGFVSANVAVALLLAATTGIALIKRYDVVAAATLIAVGIFVDWYQIVALPRGFPFVSLLLALTLIALTFARSREEKPWRFLPGWWLWVLLLLLLVVEIPHSLNLVDAVVYVMNVGVSAWCFWTLGNLIVTDVTRLKTLLALLSLLATIIAVHSIIEGVTGLFVLTTPHEAAYLASFNHFTLAGTHSIRAGSFLLNPDSNGAYLAMMLFLPIGLAVASTNITSRLLYAAEAIIIMGGLLFTYTTAAWIACAGGLLVFIFLGVRGWYRIAALGVVTAAGIGIVVLLPNQLHLLLKHASSPGELQLRESIWRNALNIIHSYPLTGIGLGTGKVYAERASSYRVLLFYHVADHPHNSFLELAALAGIPVLFTYILILSSTLLRAARNYRLTSWRDRPLLAGVLAALGALTIHAFADATWTLPPLVSLAWLLAGAVSSTRLRLWLYPRKGASDAVL